MEQLNVLARAVLGALALALLGLTACSTTPPEATQAALPQPEIPAKIRATGRAPRPTRAASASSLT